MKLKILSIILSCLLLFVGCGKQNEQPIELNANGQNETIEQQKTEETKSEVITDIVSESGNETTFLRYTKIKVENNKNINNAKLVDTGDLEERIFTKEELEAIPVADNLVPFKLEASDLSLAGRVTPELEKRAEETKKDYQVIRYLDFSLCYDNQKYKEETNKPLVVEFKLPLDLRNEDGIEKEYKIIRFNEEYIDWLDTTYNKENQTISFETDVFSGISGDEIHCFILAYKPL